MAIQMELYELKNLCMEMASLGAANYVKQTIPAKDLIWQREAYRLLSLIHIYHVDENMRVTDIYIAKSWDSIDAANRKVLGIYFFSVTSSKDSLT